LRRRRLMKTESGEYSTDDLERDQFMPWDVIRNYQARNIIRDEFKVGDEVLIYRSRGRMPGVAGIGMIVKDAVHNAKADDVMFSVDKTPIFLDFERNGCIRLDEVCVYADKKGTAGNPLLSGHQTAG